MKRKLLSILIVLFLLPWESVAQDRAVSGKVTSADDGSGLPGVTVFIKGTTNATNTDADGSYKITVPSDNSVLTFSFVGLESQNVNVSGKSDVSVKMSADVKQLSEVVIVGYGERSTRNNIQAVSTIRPDAIKNVPAISPQQLLQGQVAGVQMVNSSGVLGSASAVRIRGASSISAGSSPLYVIDGVPLNDGGNGGFSSAQGAGSGLNPLMDINPNDISSMTVLKDAAAVAIYGSRGANGVILITTKRGSNKETKINFDYSTGFSEPTSVLKYMSADQYKTFLTDYATARGTAIPTFPAGGFDWVKGVLRTGKSNIYNVSATGGSDKTKFFVGVGYHKETGYTIGNDLERLSGRFNLDHEISKKFKIGVSYALSNTQSDRIGAENTTFGPLTSSYLQTPAVQPRDTNGVYVNTGFIANVLAIEELNDNKYKLARQTGSIFGEWNIIDNLRFRTQLGIDLAQSEEKSRVVNIVTPGGTGSYFVNQDYKWLINNTLNYDKSLGDHNFGILLGQSFETAVNKFIQVAGTGFVSDQLRNVSSASTKSTTEANGTAWALNSYFSRFNYRFKDRYLFEASARNDGSSRFGADKRNGTFYALSGGWIVSDEAFLSNSKFVNFLKLTASIGTSGNDRIGNFPSLALLAAGVGGDYAGGAGVFPSQVANPQLSWEETRQSDIGISGSILNSRLSFEINYYQKLTKGLLADVPYPLTTGFASANANIGEMKNSGWDIQINSTNVKLGDFTWETNFNIGLLKNEVIKLPTNKDPIDGRDFLAGSAAQRAIVGETQNTYFLIRYSGIDPATGDAQWLTRDGELTTTPIAADRVVAGSAIPDFTGGITNSFKYKGFDLSAFFNFSYGNKVLIDGLRFTENLGGTFNKSTDLLNYWKNPGDNAFAPALTSTTAGAGQFSRLSTSQLQDGSYMRLKNLQIGYTVPKNILSKTKYVSSVRVFALAQNIWTLQNMDFRGPDPEVSANGANSQILGESFFALPQAKTVIFGVNLSF